MASNINPYNIDGTFPVAGQDNPSQGFRDNFTNIKNNFTYAHDEINDLQNKAIVTSALAGQTINNDMGGTQITRPQLKAWTQSLLDLGAVGQIGGFGTATLDFNTANFQKFTTASPVFITFTNWPTSTGSNALGYGVMRVWIVVSDISHTVTLPQNVTIGVTDIAGYTAQTGTITFDAPGNYIFDFSSTDGGTNYLIFDVTRNRNTFRDPSIYYNPAVNSTFLLGYNNWIALDTALQLEQGQDIVSAHGSFNSVSFGNLALANVAYTQTDTGGIAGYSVTGARGNIQQATIYPVMSNDLLGYVNSLQFTGNGTGNTFSQSSSIAFYSTGANVLTGLGGNIAFYTAIDTNGEVNDNELAQAMSINSDQSVEVMGVLRTDSGIVDAGTYIDVAPNGFIIQANVSMSQIIIDSLSHTSLASGTINLPIAPPDYQKIKISTVVPIASLTISPGVGADITPSTGTGLYTTAPTSWTFIYKQGHWYRT